MNVLPFQKLGGRQRTASCRGSVKRYGFLSNVCDGVVTNVRIDSVSIAADPSPSLAPFLAKVLTLELTPTAKW